MALAYTAPTWENGGGVGISASQLQALSDCMEGLVQGSDKAITNIAISGQTITLTFADGSEETGTASGLKGISSIAKTGTSGNVDTYTITYTDGSTSTFTVTNGADGSFYIVTAGIKSTDDPYGNIEYYIGGDFYKNGVLYNQSAFYKVTLVDETEYPPSPYLIDGSSGTFTNGHYSTGSIGGIPSGATITTQIFTDSTMTTLLGEVKVLIGLRGSEGEQGPQGPAGADGADGVSPEVTITAITGGHKVTITDADHPTGQDFDVMDGANAVIPNPQGTSVGTLSSIGINGDKYDIQGGGGGIDGSTAMPTDVVATWLACAGLHQSYTTLNEVLADSGVLYALINSTNAVDYMVRSTTWASSVCANQTAMNYIGNNNYCADVLLSDSTWGAAISASTYWEEVLSGLVPTMTSATTPSGVVSAEQSHSSYPPYLMFDGNDTTRWVSSKVVTTGGAAVSTWVQYEFPSAVKINKIKALSYSSNAITQTLAIEVQGSNDGTNFTSLATGAAKSITTSDYDYEVNFANNGKYKYYRMVCTSKVTSASGSQNNLPQIYTMQLYGHVDLPPVDDRINAKADKTDIAPVENGTTASRAYAVGQQFYLSDGKLYKCKQPIAQGATFTIGTNCELAPSITDQIKALWDAINS